MKNSKILFLAKNYFEYTKSVKNGTIFDRTGLDEVEDIFLERERKKDY